MKRYPAILILLLVAVALVARFHISAMAQPAPYVLTEKPLYTLRDKQVLLQGGGYAPAKPYYVWLQTPVENSTRYTGVSFVTTENGEIPSILPVTTPPTVSLPIESTSPLGTYLLTISNSTTVDSPVAQAHYGIWGASKSVYQRTEVIRTTGGGIMPKGTLKMTIRNPGGVIVNDISVTANETGAFLATWRIPPDAMKESYTVLIQGTGTYDDSDAEFVSTSKFSVAPALLSVRVHIQPDGTYERTQKATAEFVILYPDSTPVVSMKEGLTPVAFYAGQFRRADLPLAATDTTSGIWAVERRIQRNATLGAEYRFVMPANGFDDGYGNTGPEKDVETDSFTVVPATLQVSTSLNSTTYQVPLDTITAYTQVNYPDGSSVANATVRAWLSAVGSKANATVTCDKSGGVCAIRYSFSLLDLIRLGAWTLTVEARDIYGNAGSASLGVVVEPYYFLAILIVAVVALLLARRFLSRYWRRLHLGAKRASSALRHRRKPSPLSRYINRSRNSHQTCLDCAHFVVAK